MKNNILNGALIIIAALGLLAGVALTTKAPEPSSMLFFGTGLVGVAGIFKKKND